MRSSAVVGIMLLISIGIAGYLLFRWVFVQPDDSGAFRLNATKKALGVDSIEFLPKDLPGLRKVDGIWVVEKKTAVPKDAVDAVFNASNPRLFRDAAGKDIFTYCGNASSEKMAEPLKADVIYRHAYHTDYFGRPHKWPSDVFCGDVEQRGLVAKLRFPDLGDHSTKNFWAEADAQGKLHLAVCDVTYYTPYSNNTLVSWWCIGDMKTGKWEQAYIVDSFPAICYWGHPYLVRTKQGVDLFTSKRTDGAMKKTELNVIKWESGKGFCSTIKLDEHAEINVHATASIGDTSVILYAKYSYDGPKDSGVWAAIVERDAFQTSELIEPRIWANQPKNLSLFVSGKDFFVVEDGFKDLSIRIRPAK